jgi:hypothetical protein
MLQLTIHMENPVGSDILQFIKRNVSPFGVLPITAEDGKAKEEIVTIVLSNEPVAAADEKMEMDELIANGSVLGLVEAGESG